MPPTREEIRRFIQAALRARDRVSTLEDGVLEKVLEDLREGRRDLLDQLMSGRNSSFTQAYQADILQRIRRTMTGIEAALTEDLVPVVGRVVKTADELLAETFQLAGLQGDRVPVRVLMNTRALAVAQGDYVGALVREVSNKTRDRIGTDLRRALVGGQTLEQFERSTMAGLDDPGPFGTMAVRAQTIVRTEFGRTLEMTGEVHRKTLKASGFQMVKRWVAVRDDRTRPSHLVLNGVEKKPEEYFDVGGEKALYPMDPSLSAGESINCRCTVVNRIIPPGKK